MDTQLTGTDRAHLKRALELAEGGRGKVSPNPLVGAVIVRDGGTIGEGFHAELGGLHAERAALEDCRSRGEDPTRATMYVSLEPCAHQGRQPPCTEAILEAGIGRVVVGSDDPSEKATGRGPGILRDGGVEVEFAPGEEATAARLLNQPFRKHARTGLPLVTLKLAISLDGRTRTAPGDSPWISGEGSRELVHRWRAESDAIAVGIGTVLADDPLLTARDTELPRQPARVIFDSQARLPLESQLLGTLDQSPILAVVSQEADPSRLAALRDAGAEIVVADRIDAALADLGQCNITSLFLEGGATLASAFVDADAIDEARSFVAPVLIGNPGSKRSAEGEGGGVRSGAGFFASRAEPLAEVARRKTGRRARPDTPTLPRHRTVETVGEDVLITVRLKEW